MSVIRAFIALDLTPEIRGRLDKVEAKLKDGLAGVPIRWAPGSNIHLTLKFLGDVSLSNLDVLRRVIQAESARHPKFEISVGGLGAFPSVHRPRVIWAGVEAPAELASLQNGIELELERLGYAREERDFSPHLTLGRVARNASPQEVRSIGNVVANSKVGFLGAATLGEVHLYKSDLNPTGAVYTKLFTAPLA